MSGIEEMLADLREFNYELPPEARLSGDWLIVGDVHCPLFSWRWIERVALVGRKMPRPRQLLVAGDFLDLSNFSIYDAVIEAPSWAQERQTARDILRIWCRVFDKVVLLEGNHERRLRKFTAAAFDETDLLALITAPDKNGAQVMARPGQVVSYARGYAIIETPNGTWRVTHPKNYSINRLTVANDLALKFNQHIIAFHEHHLALGWDRYRRHLIVNGGCLVDPAKLAYVSLDDTKAAAMVNGFVTLVAGIPRLFGDPPITEWSE